MAEASLARNEVEAHHLKAIARFGHEPADFEFVAQLDRLRSVSQPWKAEHERRMREFESWSPSRFELIELIPLYHSAAGHIRTMQKMSWDRWNLPDLDFVIASDPSRLVTATVDDNSDDVATIDGALRHVVWMNVGLMNFIKAVANHCVWTLVVPRGGLNSLLADVGRPDGSDFSSLVKELLARPFDHEAHLHADPLIHAERDALSPDGRPMSPPFRVEPVDPADRDAQAAFAVFLQGFTTFVAGHEMAHVYLGHTRSQLPIAVLVGAHMEPALAREVEADVVGLTAVWDGFAASSDRMSIDYTWLGPVVFLSSMTGIHLVGVEPFDPSLDEAAIEPAIVWRTRLSGTVAAMLNNLVRNGFQAERIRMIGLSVPPIAAAIVEWLRINAMPDGLPRYRLMADVEAELRDVCGRTLARL